jgi:hypothetical protein
MKAEEPQCDNTIPESICRLNQLRQFVDPELGDAMLGEQGAFLVSADELRIADFPALPTASDDIMAQATDVSFLLRDLCDYSSDQADGFPEFEKTESDHEKQRHVPAIRRLIEKSLRKLHLSQETVDRLIQSCSAFVADEIATERI